MSRRAEPALVGYLADLTGLPYYFVEVTDLYPATPYLLFSDPRTPGAAVDVSLGGIPAGQQDYLYLTVVDSTPGNVHATRDSVRAALNPGGVGARVSLKDEIALVKRDPESATPIQLDTSTTITESGAHPALAIDVYRVTYTRRS